MVLVKKIRKMRKSHFDVPCLPDCGRMTSKRCQATGPGLSGVPRAGVSLKGRAHAAWNEGVAPSGDFPGKSTVCVSFPPQKPKPFLSQRSRPPRSTFYRGLEREKKFRDKVWYKF